MSTTTTTTTTIQLRNDDGSKSTIKLPITVLNNLHLLPHHFNSLSLNDKGEKVEGLKPSSSWDVGVTSSLSSNLLYRPDREQRNEMQKQQMETLQRKDKRLEQREAVRCKREAVRCKWEVVRCKRGVEDVKKGIETAEVEVEWVGEDVKTKQLVGKYETISNLLQAINDRVFDTQHKIPDNGPLTELTEQDKKRLKQNDIKYITHLLQGRKGNIQSLINKGLKCLSSEELSMCGVLSEELKGSLHQSRNQEQHPAPSIQEAKQFIESIKDQPARQTAKHLLMTLALRRLPKHTEDAPVPLFEAEGTLALDRVLARQKQAAETLERLKKKLVQAEEALEEAEEALEEAEETLEEAEEALEEAKEGQKVSFGVKRAGSDGLEAEAKERGEKRRLYCS